MSSTKKRYYVISWDGNHSNPTHTPCTSFEEAQKIASLYPCAEIIKLFGSKESGSCFWVNGQLKFTTSKSGRTHKPKVKNIYKKV